MAIQRFKTLTGEDSFAGRVKTYGNTVTKAGEDISFYYVTNPGGTDYSTEDMRGLYHAFGLAGDSGDWYNSFNISDHINAGDMVVGSFATAEDLGTYVQGNTVQITVPTGTNGTDLVKYYGSTWNSASVDTTDEQLASEFHPVHRDHGSAIAFLFSGDRWTGETSDSSMNPAVNTWEPATPTNLHHKATLKHNAVDGVGDIPEGICFLEKGLFCIFDNTNRETTAVSSGMSSDSMWSSTNANFIATTFTGGSSEQNTDGAHRDNIVFTGTGAESNCIVSYNTVEKEHKLVYFCHAKPSEFNSTSNHTYDHQKAFYRPDEADPLYITEVALYNTNLSKHKPIAYAKLSEPVEKTKFDTLTLKVEIVV